MLVELASGAAMRSGPVGLLPEVTEVLHRTEVQARITHDTAAGVAAAQAAALAVRASVALGAAARSEQITQDLPEPLLSGLENGAYGRDFLAELDRRLLGHSSTTVTPNSSS